MSSCAAPAISNPSSKPASAYEHYRKLMRDFNALEDELQASASEQQQLRSSFLRAKSVAEASEQRRRQREAAKWAAERDQQLHAIVGQEDRVCRLGQQLDELQQLETRLSVELELLRERQAAERMTEAVKLRQLVHDKADLLEKELTRGRMDLDAIAQIIDAAPVAAADEAIAGREGSSAVAAAGSPVRALVQNVQARRRDEFEAARRRVDAQLAALTREQQSLQARAAELRTRQQRALQILSSNQQAAVKDFFAALSAPLDADMATLAVSVPPASDAIARHAASLDFAAIVGGMDPRAPSSALDALEMDKEAARRQLEAALELAHAALERGAARVVDVEREIVRRQQQAGALDDALHTAALTRQHRQALAAAPWTLASCPPELRRLALLTRDLLIECADRAVEAAERRRPSADVIARDLLSETLLREVVGETAAQLLRELRAAPDKKPRTGVGSALRGLFHRGKRR